MRRFGAAPDLHRQTELLQHPRERHRRVRDMRHFTLLEPPRRCGDNALPVARRLHTTIGKGLDERGLGVFGQTPKIDARRHGV